MTSEVRHRQCTCKTVQQHFTQLFDPSHRVNTQDLEGEATKTHVFSCGHFLEASDGDAEEPKCLSCDSQACSVMTLSKEARAVITQFFATKYVENSLPRISEVDAAVLLHLDPALNSLSASERDFLFNVYVNFKKGTEF